MERVNYKKNNRHVLWALLAMCMFVLMLASCGGKKLNPAEATPDSMKENSAGITVYYVGNDKTTLLSSSYVPSCDPADTKAMVAEILNVLQTNPTNLATAAPVSGNVILKDYQLDDTVLTLNFDVLYGMQDEVGEILNRAAIVRTLLQIERVDNVLFLVDGTALMKKNGEPVGAMNASTFLFNAGSELHTYDRVRILLYFANETGDALIPVYRTMIYNSNMSMERLIVEQMILGPQTEGAYPAVNPETKVINVSLQDGICYVDLNDAFIASALNVSSNVTVFSLVNSLTELTGVMRVQITVNGQAPASLSAQNLFDTPLERNADLIINP